MFACDVLYLENNEKIISDRNTISDIKKGIQNGNVYVIKNVISEQTIQKIREYLTSVGRNSLPNYMPINANCPNFHRVNQWDERSYVKACFHQFVFFPWNQDVFDFFNLFKSVYYLRNIINGVSKEKFLKQEPEDDCIARIAFQFYPSGIGSMNRHVDPVDHHQLSVPVLLMSNKGKDFKSGGAFVEKENGERIILEDVAKSGDVIYFNARIAHGVETIDPESEADWLSFKGRWMALFAVNKLSHNTSIADAVDLEANLLSHK